MDVDEEELEEVEGRNCNEDKVSQKTIYFQLKKDQLNKKTLL